MMRIASAHDELADFCGADDTYDNKGDCELRRLMEGVNEDQSNDCSDKLIERKKAELRKKYEIPDGVYLFSSVFEGAVRRSDIKYTKNHIADFAKGKMTDETFGDLHFYFEEVAQIDWRWVLVGEPFFYYEESRHDSEDESFEDRITELHSIATRSKSKNKRPAPFTWASNE